MSIVRDREFGGRRSSVRTLRTPLLTALLVLGLLAGATSWARGATPIASPEASPIAPVSTDPAFAFGPFRITVVSAQRAASLPDLSLAAKDGEEWFAIVLDVANWGSQPALLAPRSFTLRFTGATEGTTLAPRSTANLAKQLGIEPLNVNRGVSIAPGASSRVVLAFQPNAGGVDPTLVVQDALMPLAGPLASGRTAISLPAAGAAPALASTEQAVTGVPSGDTLQLGTQTVRLTGVDAPEPVECYGGQAIARLKRLAGERVAIEPDPSDPGAAFVWASQSDGGWLLLNAALIANGYGAGAPVTGSYGAWLGATAVDAKERNTGLWAACTSAHGVARAKGPDLRTLTIKIDGTPRDYAVWIAWAPLLVTKPDGSAWAFFSAEPTTGPDVGNKRLFASYYDPATDSWSDGSPMPGGDVQMGPSAVVDDRGLVHLVYCDRAKDADGVYSQIVYTHEDGNGGWTAPTPVAPDPEAGFQLSPSLALDKAGGLHVLWQDQRTFAAEARNASAANADILASDLTPGGTWTKPVLVNTHYFDAVGSRPHLVADGDRLVAVWSVYAASLGLTAAARVEWATRPLDQAAAWSTPEVLIVGRGDGFGGRLLDMAADPNGGAVLVYGRQNVDTFLFMRRLAPGASDWSADTLLTFSDRGSYPAVAVSPDGTVYAAYNVGTGATVDVGAVAAPFRSIEPGPEVVLTRDIVSTQGIAGVTSDVTGRPWLIFYSEPPGGAANAVMVLRNAQIPATVAEAADMAATAAAAGTPTPIISAESTPAAEATPAP